MRFLKNFNLTHQFITFLIIPEKNKHVSKWVISVWVLRWVSVLVFFSILFLVIMSMDYIHVLGQLSENKKLRNENHKLSQELQQVKNKVEGMELTIERVRNYAKKLQVILGQEGQRDILSEPQLIKPQEENKVPFSSKTDKHSQLDPSTQGLTKRLYEIEKASLTTEYQLSHMQDFLVLKRTIADATPSIIPLEGYISSNFGYRRDPYDGQFRFHAGVDIVADPGSPVRSPAAGIIRYCGYQSGYGKVVVIDHGYGIGTLFAHNERTFVNEGDKVKRGQILSQVGSTGHSTGPHLHYEVRKNGAPVNPTLFFNPTRGILSTSYKH